MSFKSWESKWGYSNNHIMILHFIHRFLVIRSKTLNHWKAQPPPLKNWRWTLRLKRQSWARNVNKLSWLFVRHLNKPINALTRVVWRPMSTGRALLITWKNIRANIPISASTRVAQRVTSIIRCSVNIYRHMSDPKDGNVPIKDVLILSGVIENYHVIPRITHKWNCGDALIQDVIEPLLSTLSIEDT